MADQNRLENLLNDLFSLEVNTILKQGMMATKMPNAAHALIDIARDYAYELNRLDPAKWQELPNTVEHVPPPPGPQSGPPLDDALGETFHQLRTRAARAARALQGLPRDEEAAEKALPTAKLTDAENANLLLLCRIRDTSDQLKGLVPEGRSFNRQNADDEVIPLDDRQRLVLRKAWEIGTEQVVMQTVVYLDGDVITRIRPDIAEGNRRDLLDVHQKGVDTSMAFWRHLVDVVRSIVGAFKPVK
jgi:hypothetical protein